MEFTHTQVDELMSDYGKILFSAKLGEFNLERINNFLNEIFESKSKELRERMLSDILVTLSQYKEIDKDFLKFMDIYLCDIRGDNCRNEIAHGLLPLEAYTKENAQLLLFILIKLASYNIVKRDEIKGAK